jgi:hypothetical protein
MNAKKSGTTITDIRTRKEADLEEIWKRSGNRYINCVTVKHPTDYEKRIKPTEKNQVDISHDYPGLIHTFLFSIWSDSIRYSGF